MFVSIWIFFTSLISRIRQLFFQKRGPVTGSLYDLEAKSLDGRIIPFSEYRGKKLLIVNTASRCGFTNQYRDLQKLHETYRGKLEILAFPSNDFLRQEPGANEDIASFCSLNFGVTFQMFEKISVRGKNMHPVYKWLSARSGNSPSWNFCKYVVDENEQVRGFFQPKIKPLDKRITNLI